MDLHTIGGWATCNVADGARVWVGAYDYQEQPSRVFIVTYNR